MARTVRKLVDGDPGYDVGEDKFEVTETETPTLEQVNTCSVADVQTQIDVATARKAAEVARWDDRIAILAQLKIDLNAAV